MLTRDPLNFFNSNIIEHHEDIVTCVNHWVDHYNNMIITALDDYQRQTFQNEFDSYKLYDI